jgi:thiol-disulfide isomerase/thioredoxin
LSNSLGKSALKVLLGLLFIASAILKLVDMDKFEIYIYSYHFFSLNASFIVARLAIILELVLGIGLVSHCLHKLMWWGSMVMLGGYTLLLIYALTLGRTDSCHCFGDFLQLDPKQSLIKNGVLILLFLLIYRMESWKTPFRWLILCLAVMASSIAVFVISPPDNLTSNSDPEQNLHTELFNEMLDDAPLDALNLREGKQVICFFSTSCEVCQMAAHKLSLMQQFYGFPKENITYLFMGTEEGIAGFYEQSESAHYRDVLYPDVARLLKVVNGNLPVIVFLEDGEVVHEYGFRNMDEAEIKAFMAPEVIEPVEMPR